MGCQPKSCPETIPPGERPHRVKWERQGTADDGHGGQEVTWTLLGTLWAKAEQLSASEILARGGLVGEATVRFSFNWTPTLDGMRQSDRLEFRGRLYNIQSINNIDFANTLLEVTASAGVVQ